MPTDIRLLRSRLQRLLRQLPYLPRTLALVWEAAGRRMLVWLGLLAVQGLLPAATVYLTKVLVDRLVASVNSGGDWQQVYPVIILALLMAALMLLNEALGGLGRWVHAIQSELIQDHITGLIHEQSTTVDLAFYESPEYFDHLYRARQEASYRPTELLAGMGSLLQNSITLVAMAAILIPYGIWLPVILLASTLPAFVVVLRHRLREHEWRQHTTEDQRRSWYYDWLLTGGETAAEIRLFGLGGHFRDLYQGLRSRLRRERLQLVRSQGLAELGAGIIALLVTGGVMAWMVWQALNGVVSLGVVALFYQAFNQGQKLMHSLLQNVGQLYANSLFLGNLFEFLGLEPKVAEPLVPRAIPTGIRQSIRFEDVSFTYPGSSRPALENFSLTIPANRIVAIVGPNGSGKSTLIKLLCRLYDPASGSIAFDDVALGDYSLAELRRLVTVIFQEPVRYNSTVAENIQLGDLANEPDRERIIEAARAAGAGAAIENLADGYDTLLGKWFAGGTELSGGEWKKIALARALVRPAPLILLDEPTSEMDPWAEALWVEHFRKAAANRTAIVITHRFATARAADLIYVMAGGRIIESGSHEELLALGGRYAALWEKGGERGLSAEDWGESAVRRETGDVRRD